jgi:hypothetical protein
MQMMIATLIVLTATPDLEQAARTIMADFGYPNFQARGTRTPSGGMVFENETVTLRIDKHGRPWVMKIKGVKFERSEAAKARQKVNQLLAKYPLDLVPGQWMTERPKAPDIPYGMASSSFRYYYVPVVKGYPYLAGGQMTVQFSSDLKRVLEWSYGPLSLKPAELPRRILTKEEALREFHRQARSRIAGHADRSYGIEEERLRLGWVHLDQPKLAYAVPVSFYTKLPHTVRGGGSIALIDAGTGRPLPWRASDAEGGAGP